MKAVLQRVKSCTVNVDNAQISRIDKGLCVFLGVGKNDVEADADYLISKITNLRVFEDEKGKMNYSVRDIEGQLMIVSQFTLFANSQKGNRPSFDEAADAQKALNLYEYFVREISVLSGLDVKAGKFAAKMQVDILNDGPVTILLDSK